MTKMRLRHDATTVTIDWCASAEFVALRRHRRFVMSLQDARIVILGGTSGLGFATAQAAARERARVVIASSSGERVDRAVAALPAGTEGFVVDVSREDDIARFFATVGPFDPLVFTAGESLTPRPLTTMRLQAARAAV